MGVFCGLAAAVGGALPVPALTPPRPSRPPFWRPLPPAPGGWGVHRAARRAALPPGRGAAALSKAPPLFHPRLAGGGGSGGAKGQWRRVGVGKASAYQRVSLFSVLAARSRAPTTGAPPSPPSMSPEGKRWTSACCEGASRYPPPEGGAPTSRACGSHSPRGCQEDGRVWSACTTPCTRTAAAGSPRGDPHPQPLVVSTCSW